MLSDVTKSKLMLQKKREPHIENSSKQTEINRKRNKSTQPPQENSSKQTEINRKRKRSITPLNPQILAVKFHLRKQMPQEKNQKETKTRKITALKEIVVRKTQIK